MPILHSTIRQPKRTGAAMLSRVVLIAALVSTLPACQPQTPPSSATSAANRETALVDEIESQVAMPKGSGPLKDYARFYAEAPAGKIVGLYIRGGNGNLPSGARRWVRFEALPSIDDGGCSVVNIVFDLTTRKVEQVVCNGLA